MKTLIRRLALLLALAPVAPQFVGALEANENADAQKASKVSGSTSKSKRSGPAKVGEARQVEMFEAMDQGLIQVDYIGKDSTQANVIFKNKSGESLDIVLPETFGAVPVVAQGIGLGGMGGGMGGMGGGGMGGMGGGGMGGMGGGMGGMGGGGQGMGGGFGGGGMGGMGGGGMGGMGGGGMGGMGMGGMMRVEPDRPRKVAVATLCLEHGKADPNPRMKYRIVRLSEVNANPEVAELCKAVAKGQVPQNTAQAAAWHIANGLSWEELASKPRKVCEYTGIELYFSNVEIQNALRLTSMARSAAENSVESTSPGFTSGSTGESALYTSPGDAK
jgi:hypothetical protein